MDIGQLQQNVRYHLERVFLEQGKAFATSEAQRNDLEKKLEQIESQKKELQETLEKMKSQKKEHQKTQESKDPFKMFKVKYHMKESQRRELQKKHQETEAENIELRQKLDRVLMKLRQSEMLNLEKRKEKVRFSVQKGQLQKQIEELQEKITELESHKDYDGDVVQDMVTIRKILKEKEEDLEDAEALINVLTVKDRKSNAELQEARRKLISGWKSSSSALIGVKRMGELDSKPFHTVCKRKYPTEADEQAAALCSLWEGYITDSQWQPFKTSTHSKVVIDEEDERLKKLKVEFGAEAVEAVSTALLELNECNPSGRYTIEELWNFELGKRASVGEGISFLQEQLNERIPRRSTTNVAEVGNKFMKS